MSENQNLDMNDPKIQQTFLKCINYLNNQNSNNNMNMNYNMNNINMMNMMNNYMNNMMNMNNNINNMNMGMNNYGMNNIYKEFNMNNNINNNMSNSMSNLNNSINNSMNNNEGNNPMNFSMGNININQNNNNSNLNQQKELLPRGNKVIHDNEAFIKGENIKNISFEASTGLKLIIKVSDKITIKELIKKYMNKIGLSENHIGKDIIFLFNGGKMDTNSEETIKKYQDFSTITVFDQNNVIGAQNYRNNLKEK